LNAKEMTLHSRTGWLPANMHGGISSSEVPKCSVQEHLPLSLKKTPAQQIYFTVAVEMQDTSKEYCLTTSVTLDSTAQ
jgi:hypothetical protein